MGRPDFYCINLYDLIDESNARTISKSALV